MTNAKTTERRGVDGVTADDLFTLAGLKTALKDGETTLDELVYELLNGEYFREAA